MKTKEDIEKLLENSKRGDLIYKMRDREKTASMHSIKEYNRDLAVYPSFVSSMLAEEKIERYMALFSRKNVGFIGNIQNAIYPIFEARDRLERFNFSGSEKSKDFENYRHDKLHDKDFFKNEVLSALFYAPDSVIVTDITEGGEPYLYLVQPSRFKQISFEKVNLDADYGRTSVRSITFEDDDDRYIHIDSEAYYSFDYEDGKLSDLIVNPHTLGYCPVTSIYLDKTHKLNNTPIVKSLDALDYLLFFKVSKNYNDTFAPWSIYSGYKDECNFEDEQGNSCQGGMLETGEGSIVGQCPKCKAGRYIGAGTFVGISAPETSDQPDLRNPVTRLDADVPSLEFIRKEVEARELDIETDMIGEYIPATKQAVNDSQVQAGKQSRMQALSRIAGNLERVHKFCLDTVARLKYGKSFRGSEFTYGRNFIAYSIDDLIATYKEVRSIGLFGAAENIKHQITTLATNKTTERSELIDALDPLEDISIEQAIDLLAQGVVSKDDLMKKVYLSSFVRFIENIQTGVKLQEIGTEIDKSKNIRNIKTQLDDYVKDKLNDAGA